MTAAAEPDITTHGTRPVVFVLNVATSGLGAIRSLGRNGITVRGFDPDARHIGFASRYATSSVCPHPVREPDLLVEFLVGQAKLLDRPAILSPASDAFVIFMSRYRTTLEPWFRFVLPPADVIEASLDKRRLYELASRVGVDHADTWYPTSMAEIHALRHEIEYPVYIKPYHSHLWQLAFPEHGKGIKVWTADELEAAFERIFPTGNEAMVQSIIAGPASNIQSVRVYISTSGEVLGAFTNRKIRQFPTEFGRAVLAESTDDPVLRDKGLAFFRDIGFQGFGLIEFKHDDRDGKLKVTDLNPRWLKTVNLATTAGVDFPLLHYRDLAGESPAPQLTYRVGVRWIDAIGDVASARTLHRNGELSLRSWAQSLTRVRSHAVFAIDDPKPWLIEYDYGRRLLRVPVSRARRLIARKPGE